MNSLFLNKGVILGTWFVFISLFISAQYQGESTFRNTTYTPYENITLLTDRDLYLAGENIWFSAFYTYKDMPEEQILSNLLYIDMYNIEGGLIIAQKFRILEGTVTGTLSIPVDAATGNYMLRAYTQYQRNFTPENYFTSILTVINPQIPVRQKYIDDSTDFKICSEDGQFFINTTSRGAIALTDSLRGKANYGNITDQQGNIIQSFEVLPNGFGTFELTPAEAIQYSVMLFLNNGDTLKKMVPDIVEEGIFIRSEITNQELNIFINNLTGFIVYGKQTYKLEIRSQGLQKRYETALTISKGEKRISVPAGRVSFGINYVIIYDEKDHIVCTHAFYSPDKDPLPVIIETTDNQFKPGDRVEVELEPLFQQNCSKGMAVAVIKHGTFMNNDSVLPAFIMNNPFLIRPYFLNNGIAYSTVEKQIKTAMIFFNNRIETGSLLSAIEEQDDMGLLYLPDIRGVSISGTVIDKSTHQPLPAREVYASVFLENPQVHIYNTLDDGSYIFSLNQVYNKQDVFICVKPDDNNECEILVNNEFSTSLPKITGTPVMPDSSYRRLLEEMYINYQLEEKYHSIHNTLLIPEVYHQEFYADNIITVDLKDYIELPTMEDVFNEIVSYVRIRKEKENYSFRILNEELNYLSGDPLVLFDNVPLFNANEVMKVPPSLIRRIQVINDLHIFGDHVLSGVIMIYSNSDHFAGINLPEESVFLEYLAASVTAPFMPITDELTDKTPERLPDFRNVLYWNPDLPLSDEAPGFSFYTSDDCSEYDIVIRGLTDDGLVCYGRKSILIRRD